MSATETAHEAANPAARRRRRRCRAAAALAVGALGLGGLIATGGGAPREAAHATLDAASPSSTPVPMIPDRAGGHRITKTKIGLFTATPTQLPPAGGKVHLIAVVQGARSCSFSLNGVAHPAAARSCRAGNVLLTVTLPRNEGSKARTFHFRLRVTGPHSATSAGPVSVTELAPASLDTAPKITTQPTGRSISVGASVTFTAAATGSSSVQWQVSGDGGQSWSDVAGADSASYTFSPTEADSGREYRAVFANSRGSTYTEPATLVVTATAPAPGAAPAQIAPAVTLQPVSVNVTAGAGVTFTAAASGSPAPTEQWQLSTDGGNTWTDIAGASGAGYALTAQIAQSGYLYRAAFVNAAGTAYSNAATLTVSAPQAGPAPTAQPQSQSVLVNSPVTFTATADGSPTPTVQWMYSADDGNTWTQIQGATSTSYTIQFATLADSGSYQAVFSNSAGTSTSSVATLTVSYTTSPPSVNAQPANITVIAGNSATFTASAAGTPTPSVQWLSSANGGITWVPVSGATSTTLTFPATSGESGYDYEAVFTNGSGTATSNSALLTVQTPPALAGQPASTTVANGTTASFSASASGSPSPSVQWQQLSTNSGATWTNIPSATATTYSFTASSGESGYQYRAVFTNAAGSANSNAATLSVIASAVAPQLTAQPANQAVVANTSVSFSAAASGGPTPTVQWMVSTNGGATWSTVANAISSTYTFTASASENSYEYEAVFTNVGGSATSNPATLVVGGDTSSTNWSGYVATSTDGSFTMATGSWTVPTANCSGGTTYAAMWVGIDGYGSSTVEQDGTDSDCQGGIPTYYAWIEMYGDDADGSLNDGSSVTLPDVVSAGDSMSATISYATGKWTLAIADLTRSWSDSTPVTWDASSSASPQQLSAEWVVERPDVCNGTSCAVASLTNFGTTGFGGISATKSGTNESLKALGAFPLQMSTSSPSSVLLALPAPYTGVGSSFSDSFFHSS